MSEENVQQPKRRGRPPKVRLPEGVVKAADLPSNVPVYQCPQPVSVPFGSVTYTPTPLLTLHLRRAKNEITDATGTVHIPASGAIPDGTKLVARFYREE
jgi:hypothetical protein